MRSNSFEKQEMREREMGWKKAGELRGFPIE